MYIYICITKTFWTLHFSIYNNILNSLNENVNEFIFTRNIQENIWNLTRYWVCTEGKIIFYLFIVPIKITHKYFYIQDKWKRHRSFCFIVHRSIKREDAVWGVLFSSICSNFPLDYGVSVPIVKWWYTLHKVIQRICIPIPVSNIVQRNWKHFI